MNTSKARNAFSSLTLLLLVTACGPGAASTNPRQMPSLESYSEEIGSEAMDQIQCFDLRVSRHDPERLFSTENAFTFSKRGPVTYLVSTPHESIEPPLHLKHSVQDETSIYAAPRFWISTAPVENEPTIEHAGETYEVVEYVEEGDIGGHCLMKSSDLAMLRALSAE